MLAHITLINFIEFETIHSFIEKFIVEGSEVGGVFPAKDSHAFCTRP